MSAESAGRGTLLYDGTCGFCRGSVRRLAGFDDRRRLNFLPRESEEGQAISARLGIPADVNSMVLVENGVAGERVFLHSTGVLRAIALTGGWRVVARLGLLIPRFLRDAVYRFIARHRRQWSRACDDGCALP